jgi:hypothetical protein
MIKNLDMNKNEVVILIGIITAILIIVNLIISIIISQELKKNKISSEIAHRRGVIFKYLKIYKEITVKNTGKPGSLYFLFIISFVMFMSTLFLGIILSSIY